MNRKEIEEELRREADVSDVPDIYDRILSAAQEEGFAAKEFAPVSSERRRPSADKRRNCERSVRQKTTVRLAAGLTAAVLCLGVVLPVSLHALNQIDKPSETIELSVEEMYGLSAVTTVSLLNSTLSGSTAVSALSAVPCGSQANGASPTGDGAAQRQAEVFHEYFLMLEVFLGEGTICTTTAQNTGEAFGEYETVLTVQGCDLYGNGVSHRMYYTETLVESKEEKDEKKAEYVLEGVMVTGESVYELSGERKTKTETEDGETESEEEFRMRAYPNGSERNTYVEMRQDFSVEEDETEKKYVYSVIESGSVTEQTILRFESETKGDKVEVQYRLEFLSGKGKGSYKLEKESESGGTRIKVEYEIDGEKGFFRITETEGGDYVYGYSDGSEKHFGKNKKTSVQVV